jgi:lysophospholipase L1-like esterase
LRTWETRQLTIRRKLLYSIVTLGLVFSLIEGTAQFVWWRLEVRSLRYTRYQGEQILRNDAINFMKEPDDVLGYTLKPGTYKNDLWINDQRFPQRETTPIERRPGYLRVVCLGESTTFGNNSLSNYPAYLREILERDGRGFQGYEVINGGVPGWVSDQIALRVRYQIARYKPDVVILYAGWNDFQSYDPLGTAPQISYFETAYKSRTWTQRATRGLKSVALLSALYHSRDPVVQSASTTQNSPTRNYRFLMHNLDGIAADLRAENPKVRIFVSTLVGRWPEGTSEEWAKIPAVWWMTLHGLTPETVVPFVNQFNDQLRDFARTRGLGLIDMAAAFQTLDRAKLQWDWAHMSSEGYELMAWNMFLALQKAGILQGQEDQRYTALSARYQMNVSAAESR